MALPFLIGKTAVKCVRCISSDGELALGTAIEASKSKGIFQNFVKHRLDFFHLFVQPWLNKFSTQELDISRQSILDNIYKFVQSFVYTCETRKEFEVSFSCYKKYLKLVRNDLGNDTVLHVENIVDNVLKHLDRCAKYEFISTTTFGFAGSNIVESANGRMKHGTFRIDSRFTIDKSSYYLLKQVELHAHKRNLEMSQGICRKKLWSNSNTKEYLSSYAEGKSRLVQCSLDYVDTTFYIPCIVTANSWFLSFFFR